jgi:WD40 repeat protein
VAFNKAGTLLASACGPDVKIWDVKTGQVQRTLHGHATPVFSVDFSPDGRHLVSASQEGIIKVWNVASGKPIMSRAAEGGPVQFYRVVFTPDGKRLAAPGNFNGVKILDASTGKEQLVLAHPGRIFGAAFNSDGSRLATGSELGAIKIWKLWDAPSGKEIFSVRHPDSAAPVTVTPQSPSQPPDPRWVGQAAPEIEGVDINGKRFKLSDYRGKVILLVFWGHWSEPCRVMYPHERSLVKRLQGKPFALVGLNSDPDRDQLKAVFQKEQITWRSFLDGRLDGPIARRWGIYGWPSLFLIDHKGIIRLRNLGSPGGEVLDKMIDELIAKVGVKKDAIGPWEEKQH